jgi:agmatinase
MQFGQGEIPAEYTRYAAARTVILPVPYEGTVSYGKGTASAPAAVLEASRFQEYYDDELGKLTYKTGIATLPALKTEKTPEKMAAMVEKVSLREIKNNKFVFMLGGEHSLSYGLYRALTVKYRRLSVVQIDAHADLRETFKGSRFSHGCVMRRICETCDSTAQIGIRSVCREEAAFIRKKKKDVYWARDIAGKSGWISRMLKKLHRDVFLTIDVDGFDPSVVPHTGTPEPGGLSWYEGLKLFREIFKRKNVVGMDLVEVASDKTSRISDFTAAKLMYRLIGYKYCLGV